MEPWYSGMGAVILALVTIISLALISIGIIAYRVSKKTAHDYILAGGGLGWVVYFFTGAFTIMSAWTFYGLAGWAYAQGMGICMPWYMFIHLFQALLLGVFGLRMWAASRLYGHITPITLFCSRLGNEKIAPLFSAVNLVFLIIYMALQPAAIALGLNILIGAPFEFGFFYGVIISTIMILLGGMRSAAWGNVLMGIWFLIAFFGTFAIAVAAVPGGLSVAVQTVSANTPWVYSNPDPFGPLMLTGIERTAYALGYILSGFSGCLWIHLLYLPMTAKHPNVLRRYPPMQMALFCVIFTVMAYTMGATIGHYLPLGTFKADQVVQVLATNLGGVWWGAFVYVGAFCAAVTTIVTMQVAAGSLFSVDIISTFKKDLSERLRLLLTRVFLAVITVIAAYFGWLATFGWKSIGLPGPVPLVDFLNILASPGFALNVVLLLSLYWKRATWIGAVTSYLVGFAVLAVGYIYPPFMQAVTGIRGVPALVLALPIELILFFVVSYITKPAPPDIVEKYFEKVDQYIYHSIAEVKSAAEIKEAKGEATAPKVP
ncbi:MAG: sodium:solute symporter family protein [Candidatus Methanomethylicaceae archaeon]